MVLVQPKRRGAEAHGPGRVRLGLERAVQRGFNQPAAVDTELPLLAAVPGEGEEQVVAGRQHHPVRVVDPVVENVQEAVRIIKVRVREPADRGNYVVPLADPERAVGGVVGRRARRYLVFGAESPVGVDHGPREQPGERHAVDHETLTTLPRAMAQWQRRRRDGWRSSGRRGGRV